MAIPHIRYPFSLCMRYLSEDHNSLSEYIMFDSFFCIVPKVIHHHNRRHIGTYSVHQHVSYGVQDYNACVCLK